MENYLELLPVELWHIMLNYSTPKDINNARNVNDEVRGITNTKLIRDFCDSGKSIFRLLKEKKYKLAYNKIIKENNYKKYWSALPHRYKNLIIKKFNKNYKTIKNTGFIEIAEYYKELIGYEFTSHNKIICKFAQIKRVDLIVNCAANNQRELAHLLMYPALETKNIIKIMRKTDYDFWVLLNPDVYLLNIYARYNKIKKLYNTRRISNFMIINYIAKKIPVNLPRDDIDFIEFMIMCCNDQY
jgi:hypothetical protein